MDDPSLLSQVQSDSYKMTLRHFQWALDSLETSEDRHARELSESLIRAAPTPGAVHGLYTTSNGLGGLLAVQCSVRPLMSAERQVSVTGHATSAVIGQLAVADESVLQSAENAVEAIRVWLWNGAGIGLDHMHVHFQMRSLLEGAPGQGVSGPSAGLAMFFALVSELANVACSPSKVMTGTIGIKLDIGPVGGLGGYGTETGKLVGILKTKRIRVTDLFVPRTNFEKARDEMGILEEEGVRIHPIGSVHDVWRPLFDLDEEAILKKVQSNVTSRGLCEKEKGW